MKRLAYIDDLKREVDRYSPYLKQSGIFEVRFFPPTPTLDVGDIISYSPDIVLVDYLLTMSDEDRPHVTYRGSTLATRLREALSDAQREVPLVLFTSRSLVQTYDVRPEQLEMFDIRLYRDDLSKNPDLGTAVLLAVEQAFESLAAVTNRDWASLLKILGATDAEAEPLGQAAPPLDSPTHPHWGARSAFRWINGTVIHYPGILYNAAHAAAFLGLTEGAFLDVVDRIASDTAYKGPMGSVSLRWWKGRLARGAFAILQEAKLPPNPAEHFAAAYEKLHGVALERNICNSSGKPGADSVCYVLKTPVRREFTLEYVVDKRPTVMEPARVSFKAIRESDRVDDELFAPEVRDRVAQLRAPSDSS